jgi:hypothetical protein
MRPRYMAVARALAVLFLLAGCSSHTTPLTEHQLVFQRVCGNHSCPAPGVTRPTTVLVVDGRTHLAPESVPVGRPLSLTVAVTPEKGSTLTHYWVAEAKKPGCCEVTADGPVGAHVLAQGAQLADGQTITLTWTPTIRGDRMLVFGYDSKAAQDRYERDGFGGLPLGSFMVS